MARLTRDIPGHPAFFLRSQSGLNHRVMRIFNQSFAITYALLGISLLVSILGVGNTLFLLIHERKWEMELLRILGFTSGQIMQIILLEAFFMALAGTILGIFLGTVVGYIIVFVINREAFGWTLFWIWPGERIALLSMALLLAATLSGLVPWMIFKKKLEKGIST
jgi:putative ABC transport system permease protein